MVQPQGPVRPCRRCHGRQRGLPPAVQRLRAEQRGQADEERRNRQSFRRSRHDLQRGQERVRALGRRRSGVAFDDRTGAQRRGAGRLEETVLRYCAYTRIRNSAGEIEVLPADIAAAMFQHGTSRDNDPQLHTHCVIFNVARTHGDGKWRAMHQHGGAPPGLRPGKRKARARPPRAAIDLGIRRTRRCSDASLSA